MCNCIFDVVEYVFFEKGVLYMLFVDIVQYVGVMCGVIYWYFVNKSELFDVMFDCVFLLIDELKWMLFDVLGGNLLEKVCQILIWCLFGVQCDLQLCCVFSILFMKCEYVVDMELLLQCNCVGMSEVLYMIDVDFVVVVGFKLLFEWFDMWCVMLMLYILVSGFVCDMLMLFDEIDVEQYVEKFVDGCFDMLCYSLVMLKDCD